MKKAATVLCLAYLVLLGCATPEYRPTSSEEKAPSTPAKPVTIAEPVKPVKIEEPLKSAKIEEPLKPENADEPKDPVARYGACVTRFRSPTVCYENYLRDEHQKARNRQEQYLAANPKTPEGIKVAILEGKVKMGMNQEEVVASWGRPRDINRSVGSWGTHEQ